VTAAVDHLVYACPRLEDGVDELARLTGLRAAYGGRHPGEGTCNALLALGPRCYLELIAPDPSQPAPQGPRPFGLDGLLRPALRGWAARVSDLPASLRAAREAGADLGEVVSGRRHTPDGRLLQWSMTWTANAGTPAIFPFLIDWGETAHPAEQAPSGLVLVKLVIRTRHPNRVLRVLEALDLSVPVESGEEGLWVTLEGPDGEVVTLSSA